ncbi:MAG TPA: DUF3291 domain-containing protein [Candidatus Binatia bacterium]|nr:DUF3291 domain-containing protein [Candidatus Binatia bacterium]
MSRLAFRTFGVLVAPYDDPRIDGFNTLGDIITAGLAAAPGYVCSIFDEDDWDGGRWGPYTYNRFFGQPVAGSPDLDASTLSVWCDLESVFRFAYTAHHRSAIRDRAEWFEPRGWPGYVAWWIDDAELPTWGDSVARLEHLHEHGSTPYAFDFHRPFLADGSACPRPHLAEP